MPPNPLTSLEVLWRLQTPDTRVRGVPPLMDGAAAGTWRGKRTRGVYMEGILLWVCPVVAPECSYGLT